MFQDFHWRRCSAKRLPELLVAGRRTCAMLRERSLTVLKKHIHIRISNPTYFVNLHGKSASKMQAAL